MKRLNRKEEAVSPVIATILMVAITVVLAATLYMMVGDIGGDGVSSLSASITHRDGTQMEIVSMTNPSSADISDITITVFTDGEELSEEYSGSITSEHWSLIDDNEASGGSRFDLYNNDLVDDDGEGLQEHFDGLENGGNLEDHFEEVVFQVDGYDGTATYEF